MERKKLILWLSICMRGWFWCCFERKLQMRKFPKEKKIIQIELCGLTFTAIYFTFIDTDDTIKIILKYRFFSAQFIFKSAPQINGPPVGKLKQRINFLKTFFWLLESRKVSPEFHSEFHRVSLIKRFPAPNLSQMAENKKRNFLCYSSPIEWRKNIWISLRRTKNRLMGITIDWNSLLTVNPICKQMFENENIFFLEIYFASDFCCRKKNVFLLQTFSRLYLFSKMKNSLIVLWFLQDFSFLARFFARMSLKESFSDEIEIKN